jgi:hypothetical protein
MLQKYLAWLQYVLVDLYLRPTFLIRVPHDNFIHIPNLLAECQKVPTSKVCVCVHAWMGGCLSVWMCKCVDV